VSEATEVSRDKILCRICSAQTHWIKKHLDEAHPTISEQDYRSRFPDAPILSPYAEHLAKAAAAKRAAEKPVAADVHMATGGASLAVVAGKEGPMQKAFHELFGFAASGEAMSKGGKPIPITVLNVVGADRELIPIPDSRHVFDLETTKVICMGLELNIPIYIYGHAGTGKTTGLVQTAAKTGRPALRVQHTINTEEAHIVGQWIVKGGETVFQLGPLAQAMINGWLYIADEYDFALPSVLAVYQPVLEGNALVIKDAPPEYRVIKPHPNFRIAASGNTNGTGDETGLYQGTNIQNAANYERFGIVHRVHYMEKPMEVKVIVQQAGISVGDAERLVDFAHRVRETYDSGKMSSTVSPRSLVYAAKLGLRRGSMLQGLQLALLNRMSSADREAAKGVAERIFSK
jgi:cobaltochelatase CobS